MIFISYYTKGDYEQVYKTRLLPSLKLGNLKYDIVEIEDRGSWDANTEYKAEFCKKMLLKHKEPVVFLDVDAVIEKYPTGLFSSNLYFNYDIALHYLDWYLLWRKVEGNPQREALSGTLYLNYNKKVFQFLEDWIGENKVSSALEQKNMQNVIEKWKDKLKIYKLPPEYCVIIMRDGSIPTWYITKKPIIIHYQASRQFKHRR